jgi:hypothetical protein
MCHIIVQTWQERLGHTRSVQTNFSFHYFYSFLEPCLLAPDLNTLTVNKQTSRLHSTHSHPSYLSCVFVLFFYLRPLLASYSFTAGFSNKIMYTSLISLMPATYHTLLVLCTAGRFCVQYKLWSSSLCNCFHPHFTSIERPEGLWRIIQCHWTSDSIIIKFYPALRTPLSRILVQLQWFTLY